MGVPTYPTIFKRSVLGAPLTNAQMDENWTNLQAYDLTLANLIAESINPDGTLTNNSVGTAALQAAAVTLANLNPALLYSIIPVDTDTGTVGAYAITARGGLGGSNLIVGGPVYDANGNYVLTNLTLNYGYYWTKSTHDTSIIVNSQLTLTASGAYTAIATSVTLTGTPNATVTASVTQAAPISAYTNGQMFFVYTANASVGPSTLNVNGIGAIPILQNGIPLVAQAIGSSSVFAVVYESGSFVLFSGGGSSSSSSSTTANSTNYTFEGTTLFSTGQVALPGSSGTSTIAHGLGVVPQTYDVFLVKTATDSTSPAIGESVSAGQFTISSAAAFLITLDATNIIVAQGASATPSLFGTAITATSWKMVVNATKITNVSNVAFPALTYLAEQPTGAFSYQNTLMGFSQGRTSGLVNATAINLTNNTVTRLAQADVALTTGHGANIALFKRVSGVVEAVFNTGLNGTYRVPALNPIVSIIPPYATYNSSGVYVLTIPASTAYTLTQGANDISWVVNGVVSTTWPGSISSANIYTTLTLNGNPNGSVTVGVLAAAATWQPLQLFAYSNNPCSERTKPVWIKESGGAITDVYVVNSNYNYGALNTMNMFWINGSNAGTTVGTALDFTNSGINNISAFAGNSGQWYPVSSNAAPLLFQYNPVSQRIYIITNEMAMMHIFILLPGWAAGNRSGAAVNDISAFWAAGSRYQYLTYVKSLAIAGDGAPWQNTYFENITVEYDLNTGLEKAIVLTRVGNPGLSGSFTRIPWLEG